MKQKHTKIQVSSPVEVVVEPVKENNSMESLETNPIAESAPMHAGVMDPEPPAAGAAFSETTEELKRHLRTAEIEAAKSRAKQFIADGQLAEARKSLAEAEALSADPKLSTVSASRARLQKFAAGVESRIRKSSEETKAAEAAARVAEDNDANAIALAAASVERAVKTVDRYSKIAAGVGLLPTFVLNFAAVLAVQITMVWKIAKIFNRTDGKNHIRGSIMSLIASVLPSTVGHGIGLAVASIPAVMTGTILGFVLAPAIAYAMTMAVGNVFIMHFESGGTLLTFDPNEFREHFYREFKKAGGMSQAA